MVALVAESGGGKSLAAGAAKHLLPVAGAIDLDGLSLGSGEGLTESYFDTVKDPNDSKKSIKQQTKTRALFVADEGEAVADMGKRNGSTLFSTLRKAVTGTTLGEANASADRRRQLFEHTYRAAVLLNIQTSLGGLLLADAAGGTPQRIIWAAATDPSIPDDAPTQPHPFTDWAPPTTTHMPIELTLDAGATQTIRNERLAVQRGKRIDPLDGHRRLMQLKLAGLLRLLSDPTGRHIGADDWALAGSIMDASDRVRANIQQATQQAATATIERKARTTAKVNAYVEADAENRALDQASKAVARKAHRHKGELLNRSTLAKSIKGSVRKVVGLDSAIERATELDWIVPNGDGWSAGKSSP